MKRPSWSSWFFLVFWVFAVLWFGPVIYHDLTSLELWSDWRHDPRWYGPLLLLSMAAIAAIIMAALREERRLSAERAAKVQRREMEMER